MGNRAEKVELTTMILVEDGTKILLQNRVKADYKGYTFMGGHAELEESFVDCAKRESFEESGLKISNPKFCGLKQFNTPDGRYIVYLFKAKKFTGKLKSSSEGNMEWVERADLDKLDKVEDFYDVLKVFDDDGVFEFVREV